MSRVHILGVPVDSLTPGEALQSLLEYVRGTEQHHVMTPNNEMLVEANKNPDFKKLLNRTSLNLADSTGLLLAARLTRQQLKSRVTGVDTVKALCKLVNQEHPVFLLGAAPGVAAKAAHALQLSNPQLEVAGTFAGSPRDEDAADIIEQINSSGAHILFVAYGAPAQDMWINKHLSSMPTIKVAMGIGGTFDFLAGTVKRAPAFMRTLGLEWLWRLVKQPSRWRRIMRAVVVFPWLVLRYGKGYSA